jgi:hypothetical protein
MFLWYTHGHFFLIISTHYLLTYLLAVVVSFENQRRPNESGTHHFFVVYLFTYLLTYGHWGRLAARDGAGPARRWMGPQMVFEVARGLRANPGI